MKTVSLVGCFINTGTAPEIYNDSMLRLAKLQLTEVTVTSAKEVMYKGKGKRGFV